MEIIVCEIAVAIVYYPEVADWVRTFDYDPEDKHFEPLCLFEGDPDILLIDNWRTYFMDVELNGKKFILISDEVNDQIKDIFTKFYGEDSASHFDSPEEQSWELFNNSKIAIAYRGGQGYYYNINIYKHSQNA